MHTIGIQSTNQLGNLKSQIQPLLDLRKRSLFRRILKWNGSAWSTQNSGTLPTLYGVWGIDANNIWAVGEGGTILRWRSGT